MNVRRIKRRKKRGAPKAISRVLIRTDDPERRSALIGLKKSLRSKPATAYQVGTISEDDKYD
jgi:hypothetical protein